MPEEAVNCRNVFKQFYLYEHRTTSVREWFIRFVRRQPIHSRQPQFSLQNFNFSVTYGEAVALIGKNGSGKSTALRLIAGIYVPTTGTVETCGLVTAVIELGAGFNIELTGAENVSLYGAIMGLSSRQLSKHRAEIEDFAGIGDFINIPVKYYSSGMRARLAFAVAVCVKPDILLIDEVLAVGDQSFQQKCIQRLLDFKSEGGTMIIVSHDATILSKLCSRAFWLENGSVVMSGAISHVLSAYQTSMMSSPRGDSAESTSLCQISN